MGVIGVSGPVTREGADGPAGPEIWGHAVEVAQTKDFGCNTDLCSDHKFRHQLCTKEFKGEVNQEMGREIGRAHV